MHSQLLSEFEEIDANNDREVSREEIVDYLVKRVPENASNKEEMLERFEVIVKVLFE
jgi:hypothetical protein